MNSVTTIMSLSSAMWRDILNGLTPSIRNSHVRLAGQKPVVAVDVDIDIMFLSQLVFLFMWRVILRYVVTRPVCSGSQCPSSLHRGPCGGSGGNGSSAIIAKTLDNSAKSVSGNVVVVVVVSSCIK